MHGGTQYFKTINFLSLLSPFWLVSSHRMNESYLHRMKEWIIHSLSTLSHPFFQLSLVSKTISHHSLGSSTRNDGSREWIDQQTLLKIHHQSTSHLKQTWSKNTNSILDNTTSSSSPHDIETLVIMGSLLVPRTIRDCFSWRETHHGIVMKTIIL